MALSLTSKVSRVRIDYLGGGLVGLGSVAYRLDDEAGGGEIAFESGYPAAGSQARTDLEILQAINGSADGFRDADGNSVTIAVNNNVDGITQASKLEENGYWNPLISGSWERFRDRVGFQVATQTDQDWEQDADTGKVTAKITHHLEPALSAADNGEQEVDLSRFFAVKKAATHEFAIAIEFDEGEKINANALDNVPELIALREVLNDERQTNDEIGTDFSALSTWEDPIELQLTVGLLTVNFQVTGITTEPGRFYLTKFQLDCEQSTAGSTESIADFAVSLTNWFWNRIVTVQTTVAD